MNYNANAAPLGMMARNVRLLLGWGWMSGLDMLWTPGIILLWDAHGVTPQQGLLMQVWFGATLLLLDVPAGVMADRLGRVKAIRLGVSIHAVSILLMLCAQSYYDFLISEIIGGIGRALRSNADEALVRASLEADNRGADFRSVWVVGLTRRIGISAAIGGVIGASLVSIDLYLPLLIATIGEVAMAISAWWLVEPPSLKVKAKSLDLAAEIAALYRMTVRAFIDYVGRPHPTRGMIAVTAAVNAFTLCGFWAAQLYLQALAMPGVGFSVVHCARFGAFTAASHLWAHYWHNPRTKSVGIALGGMLVVAFCLLALLPVNPWFIGLLLVSPIVHGGNTVLLRQQLVDELGEDGRATGLSVVSSGTRVLIMALQLVMAYAGANAYGPLAVPALLFLCLVALKKK